MTLRDKRERRVQILIDRRMLGFLKPVAVAPAQAIRKRDSLEFLSPLTKRHHSIQSADQAS